jgi:hypothetical protein
MIRTLLLALVLAVTLSSFVTHAEDIETGIFFDQDDLSRLRESYAGDPLFADLRTQLGEIDREAERKFLRSEVRYNDHLYDIPRVGNLGMKMGLLYIYTGDKDAADLARECVETLMKFPKWDYFLEGGTQVFGLQRAPNSALAVALVTEALGDLVSRSDRERWLKIMGERGTEPCFVATYGMRYPDRVKGWGFDPSSTYFEHRPYDRTLDLSRWPIILNTINLKAIPASALVLSALTYQKYLGETDDTRRWIEQGIYSVSTFKDIYARDGSYNEGVSYANYTTLHLIQAIDALRRTGVASLSGLLNWPGYTRYLLEMTTPTHEDPHAIVNFSDAGSGSQASVPFWMARETRDGLPQWFGQTLARERDHWSVLYYDPSVSAEPPVDRPHLWHSDLDWIVGRTGFSADDLVVAMRSGPPFNHEHADRNSIIVKAFGEKLVVDPWRPPYSYKDPSWKMRLTIGHSGLLIDGTGHQYVDGTEGTNSSEASATIVRSGERKGHMFWTSDATPAYKLVIPDVTSVTRTVVILYELPAIVLIDKVIKTDHPSKIQARFFGYNNDGNGRVVAEESGFTLVRPAALLAGYGLANSDVRYASSQLPIPPERARKHPFAEISTTSPEMESCMVTVLMPFKGQTSGTGTVQMKKEGNEYHAHIGISARSVNLRVIDAGPIPAFEIK